MLAKNSLLARLLASAALRAFSCSCATRFFLRDVARKHREQVRLPPRGIAEIASSTGTLCPSLCRSSSSMRLFGPRTLRGTKKSFGAFPGVSLPHICVI